MSLSGNPQGLPPDAFPVLLYGLNALLLLYLPFLGILVGGATASLVLDFFGRENRDDRALRLSRELIERSTVNRGVLFLGGLVPLPVVAYLFERILPSAAPLPWFSWIVPFGSVAAGCALLSFYRSAALRGPTGRRGDKTAGGAAGVLAIGAAAFLLFVLTGTLFNPEKLPLIRANAAFLFSFKSVTGFLLFLALSFGLAGGAALRSPDSAAGNAGPDPGYREYARSAGTRLSLGAALCLPVLVVLDLLSLPETGLSPGVFAAAAAVLLLALCAFLACRLLPAAPGARTGALVSILYVLMFLVVLAGNRAAMDNAFAGRSFPARAPGAAAAAKEGPAAEKPAEAAAAEKGKAVFDAVCAACHRFESRVVGPPLNDVVPKYKGDREKLKAFIRDPAKVDPAYPPMPHLGLPEEEIDAVARYLLTQTKGGG